MYVQIVYLCYFYTKKSRGDWSLWKLNVYSLNIPSHLAFSPRSETIRLWVGQLNWYMYVADNAKSLVDKKQSDYLSIVIIWSSRLLHILNKLHRYDIKSCLQLLFNQPQTICRNSYPIQGCIYKSTSHQISRGVPQGSVLARLRFLLLINDSPLRTLERSIVLLADDTAIIITDPDPEKLQEKCERVVLQLVNDGLRATNLH